MAVNKDGMRDCVRCCRKVQKDEDTESLSMRRSFVILIRAVSVVGSEAILWRHYMYLEFLFSLVGWYRHPHHGHSISHSNLAGHYVRLFG